MFVLGLPLSFKAQCLPQIERGLCVAGRHVVAKTQGYHLVCVWGSLIKFQGGEVDLKIMLYTRVRIFFFLYWGLPLSFKAKCLHQIDGGLCLAGCHVVARTQSYHLVCTRVAWLNSRGDGVVVKFDMFSHCYTVCLCCLHASNDPLC